ncbi:hypothetical protein GCM10011376_25030 [Nocardioides flavus (ex Wang et al. 2016)]|uniref:AI-2E family transporter n=1 Tax=Nocardioides flavus (ex Wang et al. 2016) TaxID=2058780 RepID=A0ABQ3HJN6_9ACTN|nr:hypothetical protein [Nocardioides flavus (ex Wang et al. 2016)]GHE17893.1 hypothetical protein GCM10011376_25030 [Nocardioides flavus (ex Wang et al. 2016)]
MSRTPDELLAAYGRSMAWQVPVAVGLVLTLWILGIEQWLVAGLGVFVVISPVMWLRYEAFGRGRDRQLAVLLGFALVWLAIGTGIFAVLVS